MDEDGEPDNSDNPEGPKRKKQKRGGKFMEGVQVGLNFNIKIYIEH